MSHNTNRLLMGLLALSVPLTMNMAEAALLRPDFPNVSVAEARPVGLIAGSISNNSLNVQTEANQFGDGSVQPAGGVNDPNQAGPGGGPHTADQVNGDGYKEHTGIDTVHFGAQGATPDAPQTGLNTGALKESTGIGGYSKLPTGIDQHKGETGVQAVDGYSHKDLTGLDAHKGESGVHSFSWGESTPQTDAGGDGKKAPSGVHSFSWGANTTSLGPKQDDPGPPPSPDSTGMTSIGPKQDDPANPHPSDPSSMTSIGPKQDDPANPHPSDPAGMTSIGPKQDDPANPHPTSSTTGMTSIGPKQDDPANPHPTGAASLQGSSDGPGMAPGSSGPSPKIIVQGGTPPKDAGGGSDSTAFRPGRQKPGIIIQAPNAGILQNAGPGAAIPSVSGYGLQPAAPGGGQWGGLQTTMPGGPAGLGAGAAGFQDLHHDAAGAAGMQDFHKGNQGASAASLNFTKPGMVNAPGLNGAGQATLTPQTGGALNISPNVAPGGLQNKQLPAGPQLNGAKGVLIGL